MYSSIEKKQRKEVIEKCYWPLFDLVNAGVPIGIESSGLTLEIINSIDSLWIKELSSNIKNGKIEFIGSGYSQIIGPLVPSKLNSWNQKIGLKIYKKLLNIQPNLALVNEMAYSAGIIDHYLDSSYEGIIMEWNNPRSENIHWNNEWRYLSQLALGLNNCKIPLIWSDSIAFQKFQRYVHGENDLSEYVDFIKSNLSQTERYFPIYTNDVEIFNFRPGRYSTEIKVGNNNEWARIFDFYNYISDQSWSSWVFPIDVLNSLKNINGGNKLALETSINPLPVKKQGKYNINRWALTGRDDHYINTLCYKLYKNLNKTNESNYELWKELCYLWSSDFRTHITDKRWFKFKNRLIDSVNKVRLNDNYSKKKEKYHNLSYTIDKKNLIIENANYKIILNSNKGLTIKELVFKSLNNNSLLGTIDHGFYDHISLGADFYSGHSIIERAGEHKIADLSKVYPNVKDDNDIFILKTQQQNHEYKFNNIIELFEDKILLKKNIIFNKYEKNIIRPYNFTLNPLAWDINSLYIKTNNGGASLEKFIMKGNTITHSNIYSSLISSCHAFGNTGDVFYIGDKDKMISFKCNMSISALIPSITYKELEDKFFFRLQYSAREMDETIKIDNLNQNISSQIEICKI